MRGCKQKEEKIKRKNVSKPTKRKAKTMEKEKTDYMLYSHHEDSVFTAVADAITFGFPSLRLSLAHLPPLLCSFHLLCLSFFLFLSLQVWSICNCIHQDSSTAIRKRKVAALIGATKTNTKKQTNKRNNKSKGKHESKGAWCSLCVCRARGWVGAG